MDYAGDLRDDMANSEGIDFLDSAKRAQRLITFIIPATEMQGEGYLYSRFALSDRITVAYIIMMVFQPR